MEELRERIKKYHEEEGVSYKSIAKTLGISIGVLYNFTSDVRDLRVKPAEDLDYYLKERGY